MNETKQYIIEVYGLFGRFLGYADDLGMCLDKNINHAMRFSSILEAEKVAHDISTFIRQAEIKEI